MGVADKSIKEELQNLLCSVRRQVLQAENERNRTQAGHFAGSVEDDIQHADPFVPYSTPEQALPYIPRVQQDQQLHYENGDSYEGSVLDGKYRHGWGIHTCATGDVYKGKYHLDERHGQGTFTAADGTSYHGSWQHDRAHGHGTAKYADGSQFVGEWQAGARHGWGGFWAAAGEHYEGEWLQDKMHGNGVHTFSAGVFEGRYKHGQRDKGHLSQGDLEYDGEFKDNEPHGQGVGTFKGLWTYNGAWAAGQRQGWGECRYADGGHYLGCYNMDERHEEGVLKLPGGYVYKGEWQHDKPHGTGSCKFDTGDCYMGQWHEGKRHGQGRCLLMIGDRYEGSWKNDQREGQGTCVYADGSRYQGSWRAGKRHGSGFARFADGVHFRGMWEDDAWVQSAAHPKLTRLKGPGLARAVAGQQASFTIQARDDANNRRLSGCDVFTVVLEGPDGGEVAMGRVQDQGDGTYVATYTLQVAAQHHIHVLAGDGEAVADSPYTISVLPGLPVPRQCSAQGTGCRTAVVGQAACFRVQARDAHGNDCTAAGQELGDALQLQAQLVQAEKVVPVDCEASPSGGFFTCSYTPQQPGLHVLEVTAGGRHIRGSPFSVQVLRMQELPAAPRQAKLDGAADLLLDTSAAMDCTSICSAAAVVDQVAWWAQVAKAQYAADGDFAGFDSDEEEAQERSMHPASEEAYIKANPGVAVVERMEDLWRLSKLQQERQQHQQQRQQQRQRQKRQQQCQQLQQAGCKPVAASPAVKAHKDAFSLATRPVEGVHCASTSLQETAPTQPAANECSADMQLTGGKTLDLFALD